MAKAAQDAGLTLDGTVKSMMDLQQKGGLISSKVLPHFAKRMSEAAKANGGLEKAMQSNRVAMNQMVTAAQVGADTMFKSGWSEGLTALFKDIGDLLMENEVLFVSTGKTVGKVFKGMAWVVNTILNPALSALGSVLNSLNDTFGDTTTAWVVGSGAMMVASKLLMGSFTRLGITMTAALWPVVGVMAAIAGGLIVLEEIAELVSPTGKKSVIGKIGDDFNSQFDRYNSRKTGSDAYKRQELIGGGNSKTTVVTHVNLVADKEVLATAVTTTEAFKSEVTSLQPTDNY